MENKKLTLAEAFQSLKSLTEDVFEVDDDGIARANSFIDDDIDEVTDTVIDPLAQTENELQDSYMGKAILDCVICQSKIYKDPEEVIISEDGSLANVGEVCPYCQSSDGFKVIGQVAPYEPVEEDKDDESETEVEVDSDDNSVEVDSDDDSVEVDIKNKESLDESKNTKPTKGKSIWDKIEKYLKEDIDEEPTKDYIVNWIKSNIKEIKSDLEDYKDNLDIDDTGYDDEYDIIDDEDELKAYIIMNILNVLYTHNLLKIPSNFADKKQDVEEEDFEAYEKLEYILDKDLFIYFAYLINKYDLVEVFKQILAEDSTNESIIRKNIKRNIKEDLNNVSIETDKEKITITSEPKEEPIEDIETSETMIAPVDETTESEFKSESEDEEESDYEDVDVDEFEEESFDVLGEKYLKKVYENVQSFRTTKGSIQRNSLKLEGLITFKSGKKVKTNFIFESKSIDKTGRMKLEGLNKQLAKGNKAFTLVGKMDGNKFLSESLTYNYTAKDDKSGKPTKLYGRVVR